MPKVFISHSSRDGEFVEAEIVDLLRRHGIDHWYSKDDIGGGDEWVQRIISALKQCDWFVIVLSPRSVEAKYVRYEVSWAIDNLDSGRIVPVLFEECAPDKLHFALPFIQHIDFRNAGDLPKVRADFLRRWNVAYDGKDGTTPQQPRPRRRPVVSRPAIWSASAVAVALVLGLVFWFGRLDRHSAGPGGVEDAGRQPETRLVAAKLSPAEEANRLVLATLPGLNGTWWFEEARWLAPAFRAAALTAPSGAFGAEIDPWGPEPDVVYDRLRDRLDEHAHAAQARWGWLVPAKGAKAPDDEQLTRMEAKVAADPSSFRAHDWHTLAAIRHHLTASNDQFAKSADEAYRQAIAAYDREGEKRLKALCLADYSLLLIDLNFASDAINQLDLTENLVREIEAGTPSKTKLFRSQIRSSQAVAYEVLFDWTSEARCLDEAQALLGELGPRPKPHPLQATYFERAAWMKMWQWDVEAAAGLFGKAREIRLRTEKHNPLSHLEKLHDLHGEAMIQRFRGHSRHAQDSLVAILKDIDDKLELPETKNDEIHTRNLIERKFNSLERLADCDLFDGRPAMAIKALGVALGFGRENSLFKGGDRSDEVRLHCKYALAFALAKDLENARQKIQKALEVTPKAVETGAEGPRTWVDSKARLYNQVIDAIVRLAGEGREQARGELREILRNRSTKLDRDSHELLMLAADLLIASERTDPTAAGDAEEDADLLFGLIKAIPEGSREALRSYLGRYLDSALGAKLGDQPGEVLDAVKHWAFEAWFGPREQPPSDKALLLVHLEDHMGHAILCKQDAPARHFPLEVGRAGLGKSVPPYKLPPGLASSLEGAETLICWRPPSEAPSMTFPFETPESAKLEFKVLAHAPPINR